MAENSQSNFASSGTPIKDDLQLIPQRIVPLERGNRELSVERNARCDYFPCFSNLATGVRGEITPCRKFRKGTSPSPSSFYLRLLKGEKAIKTRFLSKNDNQARPDDNWCFTGADNSVAELNNCNKRISPKSHSIRLCNGRRH